MGESLLVAATGDEVEGELAMFFRAFLPRFLVILNGDLKKRAIWLRRSSDPRKEEQNYRNLLRNPVHPTNLIQHWHYVRLREDAFERSAGFINGMQKSHQLSAKLPIARPDRA